MNYRERLLLAAHELERLRSREEELKLGLERGSGHLELLGKVNLYFNAICEKEVGENKLFIEGLINRCLKYVFGRFEVVVKEKQHGVKVVRFLEIIDEVSKVEGGKESHGGGVLAVVSFLLKFIIAFKFKFYPLLILDESFSFVSKEYRFGLSGFIKQICREFGFTVIAISHEQELSEFADKVFVLKKGGLVK